MLSMEQASTHPNGTPGKPVDLFLATRWTVVLAAKEFTSVESERAMEEICRTYWFPLYAYARKRTNCRPDAEDLTQQFFSQFLASNWISDIDRSKGRLRSFLITALKRFMANEWRKASAEKRGGGVHPISIDSGIADGRYVAAVENDLDPERLFERQWALTLLQLTMDELEKEYTDAGKADDFTVLKDSLVVANKALDYSVLAEKLGCNEGAARVGVHRHRKKFRDRYRACVAQTLPSGADVEEEMRYLVKSLAGS